MSRILLSSSFFPFFSASAKNDFTFHEFILYVVFANANTVVIRIDVTMIIESLII